MKDDQAKNHDMEKRCVLLWVPPIVGHLGLVDCSRNALRYWPPVTAIPFFTGTSMPSPSGARLGIDTGR